MDKETLDNIATAITNGRTDIVRSLINIFENGSFNDSSSDLSCDALLNDLCTPQGTLLHLATKLDHVDIVRTLLSAGADPRAINTLGRCPFDLVQSERMTAVYLDELLKCAAKSEIERIQQLVSAGVDPNSIDSPKSGNTALHWASSFRNPEAVQCLLDLGANPNMLNSEGATPLHEAVNNGSIGIVRILLMSGANPNVKGAIGKYGGKSPLDIAADEEMSSLLHEFTESTENDVLAGSLITERSPSNSICDTLSDSLNSLTLPSAISSPKQNMASYISQPLHIPPFPSLSSPPPLITDSKLHLLWPQPQNIIQTESASFPLQNRLPVHIVQTSTEVPFQDVMDVWFIHRENFASLGMECDIENVVLPNGNHRETVICSVNPQLFTKRGSYKIIVSAEQLRILSGDVLGLHYALCTLGQLFQLYFEDYSLPSLYIHDWPLLQSRALLLDLSEGSRKPTMGTLKGHIKIMSRLKISELHCYFRFDVKSEATLPYSNRELIDISNFCKQHYIEVVPVVDANPLVLYNDVKQYVTVHTKNLMTLFSSRKVQIGPALSRTLTEALKQHKGTENFWSLTSIPYSTTVMLCSSSIELAEELIPLLPLNTIFVEYGHQVEHDYDYAAKTLTLLGFNVYIGAGTATWGSIAGCPETALSTIHKASQVTSSHKCDGLIIADWKTTTHHTPLCFSWPGIVLGLGLAWNCSIHIDYLHVRLPELLNYYVFQDSEQITGYLSVELGRLEAFMHQSIQNQNNLESNKNSVLHQVLIDPDDVALENFTLDLLQQAVRHIKKFELDLQKAKPTCFQQGEIIAELRLTMDLLMFSCRLGRVMFSTGLNPTVHSCGLAVINVGIGNLPPIARTDLANRLLALTEQFRAVWLSRNLPCGLQTSLYIFNSILCKLIPENDHLLYTVNGYAN